MTMGDPNAPAGGHGDGTPSESNWLGSLPDDLTFDHKGDDGAIVKRPLREHPKLQGYKSPADLARAWWGQEQVIGKKAVGLVKPGDDASDADKAAYRSELRKMLGVPEKAEDYAFDLPQGVGKDDPMATWFRQAAHKHGLPPEEAKGLVESYLNDFARPYWQKAQESAEAENKARKAEVATALETAYGSPEKAAEACETAKRGFEAAASAAKLTPEEAKSYLDTFGDSTGMVKVWEFVGRLFKEGRFVDGPGGGGQGTDLEQSTQDFLTDVWANAQKGG